MQRGISNRELAKFLISDQPYLDKITIESLDYEDSLELTKKKLINDYVSVAESAFLYKNLFIRVDLLKKTNKEINIYEVKSKSWGYESVDDQSLKFLLRNIKGEQTKEKE